MDAFTAASASDNQINTLWSGIENDIDLLLRGGPSLAAMWRQATSSNDPKPGLDSLLDLDDGGIGGQGEKEKILREIKKRVREIEEKLGVLNKIKRERGVLLKDLKERVSAESIDRGRLAYQRVP